jgi:hypothetical protein
VSYRHAYVHNDILTIWVVDDVGQHFKRVKEGVALQEPVKHAIPWTDLASSPKKDCSSVQLPVISSSGPTRRVAPAALAWRILSMMRAALPSKSRAH